MADVTVTPASVASAAGATRAAGVAGEAFAVGKSLYRKSSDNRWYLDDNDAAQTDAVEYGISLTQAVAAGNPCVVHVDGDINPGATLTVGEVYVSGAAAGGIAPTADPANPKYRRVLGQATTASNLRFSQPRASVQVPA